MATKHLLSVREHKQKRARVKSILAADKAFKEIYLHTNVHIYIHKTSLIYK